MKKMKWNKKCELLAPAGNYDIFRAVLAAGADAVYLGGAKFGARAYADNFEQEDMLRAIDYAHLHGKKLYLTVNTMLKNTEMEQELYDYMLPFYRQGLDAVIVQDIGVFSFLKRHFPDLELHASTQMTISGVEGTRLLKEMGATRVVTSRELSCAEIRAIKESVDIEIESFVHGALCYCYSGQCLMSSMLGGRSGNRGRCAQPCRLPYTVFDEKGKRMGAKENYILSPKDLCTIEILPQLLTSGIDSLKIEGRMKSLEYAAGVVSIYRKYLDICEGYREASEAKKYKVLAEDQKKLLDFGNRSGFTKGYYGQHNGPDMMTFESPSHAKNNAQLLKQIRESYSKMELKEPVDGILVLCKGAAASFTVQCGPYCAVVEGDIVQQAQKRPLTKEEVQNRMQKTGNTPFTFSSLQIMLDEDAFIPVQSLNQLRREALEELQEQMLAAYKREEREKTEDLDFHSKKEKEESLGAKHLRVLLEAWEGFESVLDTPFVEGIYLDCNLWKREELVEGLHRAVERIKQSGKMAGFVFPAVFRQDTSKFYRKIWGRICEMPIDLFLVKSLDELAFCKEMKIPQEKILADHTLYAYSDEAGEMFQKLGVGSQCMPFELNEKELRHSNCVGKEFVLYGYQTLMVSAQCMHKNTQGCDHKQRNLALKDRYDKTFRVRNCCNDCYTLIYNSTPLCLFLQEKAIEQIPFASYRLQFTSESKREIQQILSLYDQMVLQHKKLELKKYLKDYTNGHLKRGVE